MPTSLQVADAVADAVGVAGRAGEPGLGGIAAIIDAKLSIGKQRELDALWRRISVAG